MKRDSKHRRMKITATIMVGSFLTAPIFADFSALQSLSNLTVNADSTSATSSNLTTLTPGQNLSTPDAGASYDTGNVTNTNNWSLAGTAISTSVDQNDFSANLVNNTNNTTGYAIFNGVLDMTHNVSFTGTFSTLASGPYYYLGDGLGFILSPSDVAQISSNYNNDPTGTSAANLGIGGLKNSFFLGRDFWNSPLKDSGSNSDTAYVENYVSIRSTNSNGYFISGYPSFLNPGDPNYTTNYPSPDGKATNTLSTSPTLSAYPSGWFSDPFGETKNPTTGLYTMKEIMSLSWVPDGTKNADGSVNGTLTLTVTAVNPITNLPDGAPDMVVAQVFNGSSAQTMNPTMYLGTVGISGGGTGILSYSNENTDFSSNSITAPVTVNYLDSSGNKIAASSTITANVGSTLGIVADSSTSSDSTNTFVAPTITGYSLEKAATTTVATSNNTINLIYNAASSTSNFTFAWSNAATAGSNLPATISEIGTYGQTIGTPALPSLPAGYKIDHVVGPDGNSYSDLTSALAANSTYGVSDSNFTIYLAPSSATQYATFNFAYASGVPAGTGSLPSSITQSGSAGSSITDPSPDGGFNLPTDENNIPYVISQVIGPDGIAYSDLTSAIAANPNLTPATSANGFQIIIAPKAYVIASVTVNSLTGTTNSAVTGAQAGSSFTLPNDDSNLTIPQTMSDSNGDIYYATLTLPDGTTILGDKDNEITAGNYTDKNGNTSVISVNNGNLSIAGTYQAAAQNYQVNYVLHKQAVIWQVPAAPAAITRYLSGNTTSYNWTPTTYSGLTLTSVTDSNGNVINPSNGAYSLTAGTTNSGTYLGGSYTVTYSWTNPNDSSDTGTVSQNISIYPAPIAQNAMIYANQKYMAKDNFMSAVTNSGQIINNSGVTSQINGSNVTETISDSSGNQIYSGSTNAVPSNLTTGTYQVTYTISSGTGNYTSTSLPATLAVADKTAISPMGNQTMSPATANYYSPSWWFSATNQVDNSPGSLDSTNGYKIQAVVTDPAGNVVYAGDADGNTGWGTLKAGNAYKVNYIALTYQGVQDYQTALAANSALTLAQFVQNPNSSADIVSTAITITVPDLTSIVVKSDEKLTIGDKFNPSDEILFDSSTNNSTNPSTTGTDNADGSVATADNVNGNSVSYVITDSSGNQIYSGSGTSGSLDTTNLAAGNYTITYSVKNNAGQILTAQTNLTISAAQTATYELPFTGGNGTIPYVIFAGILTFLAGLMQIKRKQKN